MSRSQLAYLRRLQQRAARARNKEKGLDISALEKNFLDFSQNGGSKLEVCIPQLYPLIGDESKHVKDALRAQFDFKIEIPTAVDYMGGFAGSPDQNLAIILAQPQSRVDPHTQNRIFLLPLVESVYTHGSSLIRDFAIHEALMGTYVTKRGDLDLREAHIFPERFSHGPYHIDLTLDTPTKTVSKFRTWKESMDEIKKNPKSSMLNPQKVRDATSKALSLRERIGSLSRYSVPESETFSVSTDTCVIRTKDTTLFYLYSNGERNRNVLVYFGKEPFEIGKAPRDLEVLNGHDHQHTLAKLVELDFYAPSVPILRERIGELSKLYDSATREAQKSIKGNHPDFERLVEELKDIEVTYKSTVNKTHRKSYALTQSHELLEFIVYPTTTDPVIHELLPRLSWNTTLRKYHNTEGFKREFEEGTEEERSSTLKKIMANLLFGNQQNYDVNQWLYENHKDYCEYNEITFDLKE